MAEYLVTLRFQYPAWDEANGIAIYVTADSKAEAIDRARRDARRDGHTPATGKGRATFTATEES